MKDLQSLLGTMNYVRLHARLAAPIRRLLKPDAQFPPTKEDDDEAALEVASAWITGGELCGRPFEAGADTSKIDWGGVVGQCDENHGKLRLLLCVSGYLAPHESNQTPFEQEFKGLLHTRRAASESSVGFPSFYILTMRILLGLIISR